jgi:hypothetical protein
MVLVTGCSTTVVGRASPAEPATAPTTSPPAPSPQDEQGRRLEAYRLAGATALVEDTLPDRTGYCFPQDEFTNTLDLEQLYFLPGTAAPILDSHGFVTAWGECGQNEAGQGTLTLSIELADPAAAAAAATELAAAARDASAQASTVLDGAPLLLTTNETEDTAQIWAPVGRMLAYVFHTAPAGSARDEAVQLITNHVELLTGFTATPPDALADLPVDPLGLATLAADPPGPRDGDYGFFGPESYLRISADPLRERVLFSQHGFVGVYREFSGTGAQELAYQIGIFRFRTADDARAVQAAYAAGEAGPPDSIPVQLPAQPDTPCRAVPLQAFGYEDRYFQRCYLVGDRHLVTVDVSPVTDPADVAAIGQVLTAQQQQLLAG